MSQPQIHALVLAAGLSRRMGAPKQLLPFGSRTVLQTVVDTLLSADLSGITVVLGHQADAVRQSLGQRPVTCCLNAHYPEGMFSSLLCGLRHLPDTADAFILALGDQPHIHAHVIQAVIRAYTTTGKGIVIPVWNKKRGHPALINLRRYREKILALSGAEGLKPLMRRYPEDTLEVPVDDAGILHDLDTPEDYRQALDTYRPDASS